MGGLPIAHPPARVDLKRATACRVFKWIHTGGCPALLRCRSGYAWRLSADATGFDTAWTVRTVGRGCRHGCAGNNAQRIIRRPIQILSNLYRRWLPLFLVSASWPRGVPTTQFEVAKFVRIMSLSIAGVEAGDRVHGLFVSRMCRTHHR